MSCLALCCCLSSFPSHVLLFPLMSFLVLCVVLPTFVLSCLALWCFVFLSALAGFPSLPSSWSWYCSSCFSWRPYAPCTTTRAITRTRPSARLKTVKPRSNRGDVVLCCLVFGLVLCCCVLCSVFCSLLFFCLVLCCLVFSCVVLCSVVWLCRVLRYVALFCPTPNTNPDPIPKPNPNSFP
jgi:hypothetical protein